MLIVKNYWNRPLSEKILIRIFLIVICSLNWLAIKAKNIYFSTHEILYKPLNTGLKIRFSKIEGFITGRKHFSSLFGKILTQHIVLRVPRLIFPFNLFPFFQQLSHYVHSIKYTAENPAVGYISSLLPISPTAITFLSSLTSVFFFQIQYISFFPSLWISILTHDHCGKV